MTIVCHASAWSIDFKEDLRVKMCIEINDEFFVTVHHELGHNFYQRAYNRLPAFFQNGANDGFHEAIGDTIALSITPEYLRQVALIDQVPSLSAEHGVAAAACTRQSRIPAVWTPRGSMALGRCFQAK